MDVRVTQGHPLNIGRVAWWLALPPLDGTPTFNDLMGRYPLSLVNAPVWRGTSRTGGFGELGFTNVGFQQGKIATAPAAFDLGPGSSFSVAGWIKYASGNATLALVAGVGTAGTVYNWAFYVNTNGGLYLGNGSGAIASTAAGAVPYDKWNHVVASKNLGTTTLFVNGVAVATGAGDLFAVANHVFRVGGQSDSFQAGQPWSGALDDVSFWGRALSAAEVARLYAESLRGYPRLLRLANRSLAPILSAGSAASAPRVWAIGEDGPQLGFFEG
jgi:hypothetical protein